MSDTPAQNADVQANQPSAEQQAFLDQTMQLVASIEQAPERVITKLWQDMLFEAKRQGVSAQGQRFTVTPHDLAVVLMMAQVPMEVGAVILAAIRRICELKAEGKINDGGLKLVLPGQGPLIA